MATQRRKNIFSIIKGPIFSDKASKLMQNKDKLVLDVDPDATKKQIEEALEKLFNVKVKRVRTQIRKGKVRKFKRYKSVGKLKKRAIIDLQEGYTIDMLGQPNVSTTNVTRSDEQGSK